tara:strand:+ start:115 stop:501 length:387 start_codon:yes stop_codon:yes gene_type:complete
LARLAVVHHGVLHVSHEDSVTHPAPHVLISTEVSSTPFELGRNCRPTPKYSGVVGVIDTFVATIPEKSIRLACFSPSSAACPFGSLGEAAKQASDKVPAVMSSNLDITLLIDSDEARVSQPNLLEFFW